MTIQIGDFIRVKDVNPFGLKLFYFLANGLTLSKALVKAQQTKNFEFMQAIYLVLTANGLCATKVNNSELLKKDVTEVFSKYTDSETTLAESRKPPCEDDLLERYNLQGSSLLLNKYKNLLEEHTKLKEEYDIVSNELQETQSKLDTLCIELMQAAGRESVEDSLAEVGDLRTEVQKSRDLLLELKSGNVTHVT